MFLAIFAGLGERIKALFERLSLLGRARRLVRVRRKLTLESLERAVRRELWHSDERPRFLWEKHKWLFENIPEIRIQKTHSSRSAAMLRRVEQILHGMKQEVVGDGTRHARNVERVREHQRRLGVLKVRLEQCILDQCGRITHLTNADGTEELDFSGVPEHLRVPWESLVRSMAMAADALSRLDDFEARVKELFTQAVAPLQERIGRYDALALIREIAAEGVNVHTTALNVRRDIEAATDQLERRISAIRDSVLVGADCIGDIVAELPYADRPGARNVGEEIERIVDGLAPQSARARQSA